MIFSDQSEACICKGVWEMSYGTQFPRMCKWKLSLSGFSFFKINISWLATCSSESLRILHVKFLNYYIYTGLFLSLSKNAHFIFAYFLLFCENLTTLATDLCRSSGNIVRSPRALTHTPCFWIISLQRNNKKTSLMFFSALLLHLHWIKNRIYKAMVWKWYTLHVHVQAIW